jgi:hypothetical protein
MEQVGIAVAGFAAVSAVLLFFAYTVFIVAPGKSVYSIGSCAALLAALLAIQIGHLRYFQGDPEPLESLYYRIGLFTVPSSFYQGTYSNQSAYPAGSSKFVLPGAPSCFFEML